MQSLSMPAHPARAELELYVLGALETGPASRIERHVRVCAPCAAALAEEARVENTLRALVPRVRAPARAARVLPLPPVRPVARRGSWSSALAVAAVVIGVWALGHGQLDSGRAPGLGAVSASFGPGQDRESTLVCELDRDEPLCRWPPAGQSTAMRSLVGRELSASDSVCRAPAGQSCPIQSRIR